MNEDFTNTMQLQVRMLPDGRMDSDNAALYLGLKPKTLAMMRCQGTGPRFIKRGKVFYFQEDLDAWINADGRFQSTTQARFYSEQNSDD